MINMGFIYGVKIFMNKSMGTFFAGLSFCNKPNIETDKENSII